MKTCPKCKIEKDESEFNKNKNKKDNLDSWCKTCKRQYRLENKEKIAEKSKQYREENKEKLNKQKKQYRLKNKEIIAEKNKEYCLKNKDKIAEKSKEYYLKNKEKINERNRQYFKLNPQAVVNARSKRRQQIKNQEITKEEWYEVMNKYDWKCVYCGCKLNDKNRTIDHLIPLNKGGENIKENIVPACRTCNCSKQDKYLHEWLHPLHLREVLKVL